MSLIDSMRKEAAVALAAKSDADIAQMIINLAGVLELTKSNDAAFMRMGIAELVGSIRAAERIRIEREEKGAEIAAACLKETP